MYDFDGREVRPARMSALVILKPGDKLGCYAYPSLEKPNCVWYAGDRQSWQQLSIIARERRRRLYDASTSELFAVPDLGYLRQLAQMPDKVCPQEGKQCKLRRCQDAEMSSALDKAAA